MSFAILPRPQQDYPIYYCWPRPAIGYVAGAGYDANMFARYSGDSATIWTTLAGTGSFTVETYRDVLTQRIRTTVANPSAIRMSDGMRFRVPWGNSNALVGAMRVPEFMRVQRWSFMTAWVSDNGGALIAPNGFAMVANTGVTNPTYPTAAGVGGGFGIQGDGVDWWQFFSKPTVAGGFTDIVAIPKPAGVTAADWQLWDIEITAASPLGAAALRIALNGTGVISRSWAAGTLLPTTTSFAGLTDFLAGICTQNSGTACQMYQGPAFITQGRYTLEANELLSPFAQGI